MSARVLMYTTAVCPYCVRVKQLLKARGVAEIEDLRLRAAGPRIIGELIVSVARTLPVERIMEIRLRTH